MTEMSDTEKAIRFVKQRILIRCADRSAFVDEISKWTLRGAVRKKNSVPRMIVPFQVEMEIEVDKNEQWKSTATAICYPVIGTFYTERELESMVFQEFRDACRLVGVVGKDREKMTHDYIEKVRLMSARPEESR